MALLSGRYEPAFASWAIRTANASATRIAFSPREKRAGNLPGIVPGCDSGWRSIHGKLDNHRQ